MSNDPRERLPADQSALSSGFFLQLIARFEPHVYSVAMKDVTSANFGLLIAFVLPGFILLWGIKPYSATIE